MQYLYIIRGRGEGGKSRRKEERKGEKKIGYLLQEHSMNLDYYVNHVDQNRSMLKIMERKVMENHDVQIMNLFHFHTHIFLVTNDLLLYDLLSLLNLMALLILLLHHYLHPTSTQSIHSFIH